MNHKIWQSLTNAEVKKLGDPRTGYNDMGWVVIILVAANSNEDDLSRCSCMQRQNLDDLLDDSEENKAYKNLPDSQYPQGSS
jgi:hypothetical protein